MEQQILQKSSAVKDLFFKVDKQEKVDNEELL